MRSQIVPKGSLSAFSIPFLSPLVRGQVLARAAPKGRGLDPGWGSGAHRGLGCHLDRPEHMGPGVPLLPRQLGGMSHTTPTSDPWVSPGFWGDLGKTPLKSNEAT